MQIKRTATADWTGTGKEGAGKLSTQSGVLCNTEYSYPTRFEDKAGTNPEELIGAAHAGCFSMKLAFIMTAGGFTPDHINTTATVILENGNIPVIMLHTKVKAHGLTAEQLHEFTSNAKENCPVSKLLNAEIMLNAELMD
ncbi:MAG: OsmC family peroxiredoxin [Saprospiraceae bacterium]|nr:OsmC family peroxiredoxin [Saprospiraceae bacterium]